MSVPAKPKDYARETGLVRSARLMRALGPSSSAVWSELDPEEAHALTRAMEALPPEDAREAEAVAEDFLREAIVMPEKRRALADSIWLKLSALDSTALAGLIANEHPQTIALIFSKLEPAASANLSKALPPPLTMEALRRLLHMNVPHASAVEAAERTLIDAMADLAVTMPNQGYQRVARIFDRLDSKAEKSFVAALENAEPGAGQRVRSLMFTFEDVAKLDAAGLQTLLSGLDRSRLALALKGAPEKIETAFFANMTQRAGAVLREEISALGAVPRSDVDSARAHVVDAARQLLERGEISQPRLQSDDMVE